MHNLVCRNIIQKADAYIRWQQKMLIISDNQDASVGGEGLHTCLPSKKHYTDPPNR